MTFWIWLHGRQGFNWKRSGHYWTLTLRYVTITRWRVSQTALLETFDGPSVLARVALQGARMHKHSQRCRQEFNHGLLICSAGQRILLELSTDDKPRVTLG